MTLRKAIGRLLFFHNSQGKDKPVHHMKLELRDRDLAFDDMLASGETDLDGRFELSYDPKKAGRGDEPDLCLRVLAPTAYNYDPDGTPKVTLSSIASFDAEDNIEVDVYDFGDLHVAYWEYENPEEKGKIAFTPRVAIVNGEVPQAPKRGTKAASVLAYTRHLLTYQKHKVINKFESNRPTNETIQAAYPKNLTQLMEAQTQGSSRSDEYLVDLVLNGFNPCRFKKNEAGELYVPFLWNGLEQDGDHFGPNTTAYFRLEGGTLKLDRIDVAKRIHGDQSAHAMYREPKTYHPGDPAWGRVKRLFRINLFLFGEVDTHLGETHLNVEQYIVPIVRNLRNNPVARMLEPHFFGTVSINKGANSLLIDQDGIVGATSALTPGSVAQLARCAFAGYNWYKFKPRPPIGVNHRFAILANTFWSVLEDYVTWFFTTHDKEIRAEWAEIRRMSDELVYHAVPYLPQLDKQWADTSEINTADKPHPVVNGVEVAISPVTLSDVADEEGLANLKQLCMYLLYHATFKHSWVNDKQYDIGGEIEFATLGINKDITNLEIPEDTAVNPVDAIEHPFITLFLSSVKYGYLMRNEDHDVHPKLRELLKAKEQDFTAQGVSIRDIRSRIDI